HVFKYEELHDRWPEIAAVMGVSAEAKLPRVVVGRQNSERIASRLSPKTKALLQELYPDDFEALGYAP
ncbi:MAG: sulfotransferase family 2 domain-containing protein, partial [Bacteroidota bacterium]|nr:sulfotransferase family 2 domain-containing protein [Bacteroidota bacterium]